MRQVSLDCDRVGGPEQRQVVKVAGGGGCCIQRLSRFVADDLGDQALPCGVHGLGSLLGQRCREPLNPDIEARAFRAVAAGPNGVGGHSRIRARIFGYGTAMTHNPFLDFLGVDEPTVEDGRARLHLEAVDRHLNPSGGVHGGVLATLVDAAMGVAVRAGPATARCPRPAS